MRSLCGDGRAPALPVRRLAAAARAAGPVALGLCALAMLLLLLAAPSAPPEDPLADQYERRICEWLSRVQPALGAGGAAARLADPGQRARGRAALRSHAVDTVLSARIPLNRTIREVRHPLCARQRYEEEAGAEGALPAASVVIAFHSEPLSLLLRTVASVLRDAARHGGVLEVVLVDDGSTGEDSGGLLGHYVRTRLPPAVRLLRLPQQLGVVGARTAGAKAARGEVLVFLDAQCEVAEDWLRPLLARLRRRPAARVAVAPVVDTIDAATFRYSAAAPDRFSVGGFLFLGQFVWSELRPEERRSPIAPVRSPTMVGGVYAMRRSHFWALGGYDAHMQGWGGENLEMSFRLWQCGGAVEVVPCSRVGHVVLAFHRHLRDEWRTQAENVARAAEVWMDDYKELFYLYRPQLRPRQEAPGLAERRALRRRLRCRPFAWYLTHVHPRKFVPLRDDLAYGKFHNPSADVCLPAALSGGPLRASACHPPPLMHLSTRHELRSEMYCATIDRAATATTGEAEVTMRECETEPGDRWRHEPSTGRLVHEASGLCLAAAPAGAALRAAPCRRDHPAQLWRLQYGTHNNFIANASAPTRLELRLRRLRDRWRARHLH